jgi:serine/threonine-protein kinase
MVPAPYPAPVQPGDVIRGKYRVERLLGAGGMAYVVSAWHLHLAQRVAIKLLRPETAEHAEVIERFLREARASSRLEGVNIVRVLDVDALESGPPFIVMEYLEGQDLSQVLATRGPVPVHEVALWVRDACHGVAEAHALGVIHRDLKPANLFLAQKRSGEVVLKVLDFGISKLLEDTRITQTEVGMGSAEYMSPEQMRSATDVDARSDVWSLGVTLYEMTTGKTPFHADGVGQVAAGILMRAPASPRTLRPDLPAAFEEVVLRCLQKDPRDRYASAEGLAAALAPFAVPVATSSVSRVAPAPRTLASAVAPEPVPAPPSARVPPSVPAATAVPIPLGETPATLGGTASGASLGATPPPWATPGGTVSRAAPAPPAAPRAAVIAGVAISFLAVALIVAAFALGRQGGASPAPAASSAGRFTVDGAVLRDTATGLAWQRSPAPGNLDWESAKEHCARQKGGLRLPEIDELSSLLALGKASPPIDPANFSSTPADVFWSSSPAGRGAAMVIHFSSGKRGSSVVSALNRVRCVR